MTSFTSPRFHAPRQSGSRRLVGSWGAPIGAIDGGVCLASSDVIDVESMTGRSDYGQPKGCRSGAGSADGGRTP
ncbi:MAG: hypothetical protein ABIT20_25350 [Gemmatimonadaceae bacterium]